MDFVDQNGSTMAINFRSANSLIAAQPALLRPRTWEISEEWLVERGELLETRMRWEYLEKFLEAPQPRRGTSSPAGAGHLSRIWCSETEKSPRKTAPHP